MIPVEPVTRFSPFLSSTRRSFLRRLTAASAALPCLLAVPGNAEVIPSGGLHRSFDSLNSATMASNSDESILRFHIEFSESAIVDLRRRIGATKWPERETVTDTTQGAKLATMREPAHYWQSDYDWRKVEARLNGLPQAFAQAVIDVDAF
jgi:hypothetical protein